MENAGSMQFRSVTTQDFSAGISNPAVLADVTVQPDGFKLATENGGSRILSFQQLQSLQAVSYCLLAEHDDGRRTIFSRLGHDYDPFVHQAFSAWNQYILIALFVDEDCLIEACGDYQYAAPAQSWGDLSEPGITEADDKGRTRMRLYDSSLVVLPQGAPVRRLPLCFINQVQRSGYQLTIDLQQGTRLIIRRLGHDMDAFDLNLRQALQRQTDRALMLLQQILPDLNEKDEAGSSWPSLTGEGLAEAAWLLREGRAAEPAWLEQRCPGLWPRLDRLLRRWSPDGYYAALADLAGRSGYGILPVLGLRREQGTDSLAMPEMPIPAEDNQDTASKDKLLIPSFWLAAPLQSDDGQKTAVAIETISQAALPQATYLFVRPPALSDWASTWQDLNQALEAVDFRREAIYLSPEQISEPLPLRERERAALLFCPSLRRLRGQYLGRVMHRGLSGWQSRIANLIDNQSEGDHRLISSDQGASSDPTS